MDRMQNVGSQKNEEPRITPRLLAGAAGRINLPFIEKNCEGRIWGRKEQELGFIMFSLRYGVERRRGHAKSLQIKESEIEQTQSEWGVFSHTNQPSRSPTPSM